MEINNYNPYINRKDFNIKEDFYKNLDKKKAKKAAEGMEAEFLKIMFKAMKKTVPENDEVKAPGKDIMNEFMIERFAEHMANASPLGLSDMVMRYVEEQEKMKDKKIDLE